MRVFRGTVIFFSLLVLCIGLAMAFCLGVLRPESIHHYKRLMTLSNKESVNSPKQDYTAKQSRVNVQKNVSFVDHGRVLEMRLQAGKSDLMFDHQAEKTQIVEKMENVVCLMQEELYELPDHTPMQTIRSIHAKTASYYYKDDHFVADQVNYARYTFPGLTLPKNVDSGKPLMRGVAKAVEFSLDGKEMNFKAHELKATFQKGDR
jgi:hypothetical protein